MCISDRPPREPRSAEATPAPGDPRDAALKRIGGIVMRALDDGRPRAAAEALRAIAAALAVAGCAVPGDVAWPDLELFARLWWDFPPD